MEPRLLSFPVIYFFIHLKFVLEYVTYSYNSKFKGTKVTYKCLFPSLPLCLSAILVSPLWSRLLACLSGNDPSVSSKYTHLFSIIACITTFLVAMTKHSIKTTCGQKWLFWLRVQRGTAHWRREEMWSYPPGKEKGSARAQPAFSFLYFHWIWDPTQPVGQCCSLPGWVIPSQLKHSGNAFPDTSKEVSIKVIPKVAGFPIPSSQK